MLKPKQYNYKGRIKNTQNFLQKITVWWRPWCLLFVWDCQKCWCILVVIFYAAVCGAGEWYPVHSVRVSGGLLVSTVRQYKFPVFGRGRCDFWDFPFCHLAWCLNVTVMHWHIQTCATIMSIYNYYVRATKQMTHIELNSLVCFRSIFQHKVIYTTNKQNQNLWQPLSVEKTKYSAHVPH